MRGKMWSTTTLFTFVGGLFGLYGFVEGITCPPDAVGVSWIKYGEESCMYYIPVLRAFEQAITYCRDDEHPDLNTFPVIIRDTLKNKFVRTLLPQNSKIWLPLSSSTNVHRWRTWPLETASYIPANSTVNWNGYFVMNDEGNWQNNHDIIEAFPSICEYTDQDRVTTTTNVISTTTSTSTPTTTTNAISPTTTTPTATTTTVYTEASISEPAVTQSELDSSSRQIETAGSQENQTATCEQTDLSALMVTGNACVTYLRAVPESTDRKSQCVPHETCETGGCFSLCLLMDCAAVYQSKINNSCLTCDKSRPVELLDEKEWEFYIII